MRPPFLYSALLVTLVFLLSSCMFFGGNKKKNNSTESNTTFESSALVLQILDEFKAELSTRTTRLANSDRVISSLSADQAETLTQGALNALGTGGYSNSEDLTHILPLIVQGAQKSLSAFSDADKQKALKIIAPSVVKTLAGRKSLLDASSFRSGLNPLQSVLYGIAEQGVGTLDEIGLSQNGLPEQAAELMQNLIGSLGEGGLKLSEIKESLSPLVLGGISSLGNINAINAISMQEFTQKITSASMIGIGNIITSEITLKELPILGKEVGKGAVLGLGKLRFSGYGATLLASGTQKVAWGGVGALGKITMAGYDSTQLPAMGRLFLEGATSALDKISLEGYTTSHVSLALKSLASGAISAVSQIQITGYDPNNPLALVTQLSAGMQNAISALKMTGLDTNALKSAVAEGTDEGLREAGLSGVISASDLDYTPPSVTQMSPANSAINVSPSSGISVTFSKSLLASTLNARSFQVQVNGFPLPGSITSSGKAVTFTPSGSLPPSTRFDVVVSTDATDWFGNSLSQNKTWSFRTLTQRILISGHLSSNTSSALVIADKVSTGNLGNNQVDAGEVATLSSPTGNFSEMYLGYGNYVLTTQGGTRLKASGTSVAAMPLLAPGAIFGSNTGLEMSPITTLLLFQPQLLDSINALGGWNVNLNRSSGVQGRLLRVAKVSEFIWDVISKGNTVLVKDASKQQQVLPLLAQFLYLKGNLGAESSLIYAAQQTLRTILNDASFVAQDRFTSDLKTSILSALQEGVLGITQNIADSVVVESSLLSAVETKTDAALEKVFLLTDTESPSIGLNFPPTIQEIKVTRAGINILNVHAIIVDDDPSQLKFRWTLSGASFVDAQSNPAIVQNYSDSMSGKLTIFVRDQSGLEFSVSLELPQGAYPL